MQASETWHTPFLASPLVVTRVYRGDAILLSLRASSLFSEAKFGPSLLSETKFRVFSPKTTLSSLSAIHLTLNLVFVTKLL